MVSKVITVSSVVNPESEYTTTLNALMVPLLGMVLVESRVARTVAINMIAPIVKAASTIFFCRAISFSSEPVFYPNY